MHHEIRLPDGFCLSYERVMADVLGPTGLTEAEVTGCPRFESVLEAVTFMRNTGQVLGHPEPVLFPRLPYQIDEDPEGIERLEEWGRHIRSGYRTVVSLGIGGSWLGNQVVVDALLGPWHNERAEARGLPRFHFSGNNVDPVSIRALDEILDLDDTMFVVISKSGTTMETMAAFLHFYNRCRREGRDPARHFTVVTDPAHGLLREIAGHEQMTQFAVPPGIGGRFSVLSNVGLMIAAAGGVSIPRLLAGARSIDQASAEADIRQNPAALYAVICHLLYRRHGIDEGVLMPYCDALRSFALWYVQLLAESLGKERNRMGLVVNEGRTPIAAVGTADMHAQTQQHREGKRNKLVTTIAVEDFGENDIVLPTDGPWREELAFVTGHPFSRLLAAAREANEAALAADGRPSCRITIPALTPYTLGQLFYLFEMATAFEGELLDVNTFDQPGVEHYKQRMKAILGTSS